MAESTALDGLRGSGRESLLLGAVAGLVGGVAFGLAWIDLGMLPSIASLVGTDSAIVGLVVHLVISAIAGAGLGWLLRGQRGAGDVLLWGVAYAAFFWFVGPLTLAPLILGAIPSWDVPAAQAGFPSLLGHIVWGSAAALALVALTTWVSLRGQPVPPATGSGRGARPSRRGVLVRGLAAGIAGYVAVSLLPVGQERMLSPWGDAGMGQAAWLGPLAIALVWAALFALFHPASTPTAGAALVRGAGFGFLLWVIAGLTLLPALRGDGLDWSIAEAREAFPALVGSIVFGAAMGLTYHWLTRLAPILFTDGDPETPPDGGSWGLRAVLRGAAAGLVGGLIFTLVMLQIGFLATVASLVGSDSELVGLVVHLLIAVTIGASYGVLFRRQSFDAAAAVGWGVSYGFVWWILGSLTLAPAILGATPAWTIDGAAAAFPGLIGHLAFGAAMGLVFHALESRYTPWWISRTEREGARMAGRRAEANHAGPALWALLVLIAILLPTVLATASNEQPPSPYATGDRAGVATTRAQPVLQRTPVLRHRRSP